MDWGRGHFRFTVFIFAKRLLLHPYIIFEFFAVAHGCDPLCSEVRSSHDPFLQYSHQRHDLSSIIVSESSLPFAHRRDTCILRGPHRGRLPARWPCGCSPGRPIPDVLSLIPRQPIPIPSISWHEPLHPFTLSPTSLSRSLRYRRSWLFHSPRKAFSSRPRSRGTSRVEARLLRAPNLAPREGQIDPPHIRCRPAIRGISH
jgi:hypothetical protein